MALEFLGIVAANLGMLPEDIILLVTAFCGIIFMAVNLKLAFVIYLICFAMEYILFTFWGFPTDKVFLIILVNILLLALSLYTSKSEQI